MDSYRLYLKEKTSDSQVLVMTLMPKKDSRVLE